MNSVQLIIPLGTQIVSRVEIKSVLSESLCPIGAVGVITKAPTDNSHAYRVQFTNGVEAALHRNEFSIRKQHTSAETVLDESELYDFVIYRVIVGSRAYGLDTEASDTDRRGIYLPPADVHWSMFGVPEQIENKDNEECYWELQKFLVLALKANPNILECLYSPLIETTTPLANELLAMREIFLSKLVYQTYNGYVMSQFKKLEQDIRARGEIKWKHAMHLIRLLLSGVTVLREGYVPVRVDEHRDELLAIRRGEVEWNEVNARRLALHKDFDAALAMTRLPERPDYERANAFLLRARREMAERFRQDLQD
jgi:uncharacterized protein